MTSPLTMLPMMIQAVSMLGVSISRIRDFLILPELKGDIVEEPNNENDAIVVENGKFKWGCVCFMYVDIL
jgi:hypothetical protein